MLVRRVDDGVLELYVVRQDDRRDGASAERGAKRAVDDVRELLWLDDGFEVAARDILQQRAEVRLLLVLPPNPWRTLAGRRARRQAVVELRIVEPVEHVNGAGPAVHTQTPTSGELRVAVAMRPAPPRERAGTNSNRTRRRD